MGGTDVVLTGVAFVQEAMAAMKLPGGSLLGLAVNKAVEKRKREAISVLLAMIEEGKAEDIAFDESDADEFVQILMRFWHAAETGAAKRNLEFLAKVILGLKRNSSLEFDIFQKYANILELMTRDELLLVGIVYDRIKGGDCPADFKIIEEALKSTFNFGKIHALFASLIRTGLFVPASAYGGLIYHPSADFWELCKLAQVSRETATHP